MKRGSISFAVIAAVALTAHPYAQAPAPGAKPAAPAAAAGQARTVEIDGTDQMKFSVTTINAKPGEEIRVRLRIVSTMPKMAMSHNFVLLNAGVDAAAFANEAMMAGPTYIPAARKNQVYASTAMGGGGETVEVTFKAPAKAGTYTYLCTFPGHFAIGMRGTLVVK
jgi:azurin